MTAKGMTAKGMTAKDMAAKDMHSAFLTKLQSQEENKRMSTYHLFYQPWGVIQRLPDPP